MVTDRAGGGEPVRRGFRGDLGAARVGAAGRDVPQPDPRRGAGGGGRGPVGGELLHLHHLPDLLQHQPDLRLRLLRLLRAAVPPLRLLPGARDQGQGARGDGGPGGLMCGAVRSVKARMEIEVGTCRYS